MPSIRHYVDRVLERMPVTAVYLFGSYVRGTAGPHSDIDLAVVSPALSGSRFENSVKLGLLTWGVDTRIEPLGYRPDDFVKDRLLPAEILETGIRVYPDDASDKVEKRKDLIS